MLRLTDKQKDGELTIENTFLRHPIMENIEHASDCAREIGKTHRADGCERLRKLIEVSLKPLEALFALLLGVLGFKLSIDYRHNITIQFRSYLLLCTIAACDNPPSIRDRRRIALAQTSTAPRNDRYL